LPFVWAETDGKLDTNAMAKRVVVTIRIFRLEFITDVFRLKNGQVEIC
jgi:hypothetical protein